MNDLTAQDVLTAAHSLATLDRPGTGPAAGQAAGDPDQPLPIGEGHRR